MKCARSKFKFIFRIYYLLNTSLHDQYTYTMHKLLALIITIYLSVHIVFQCLRESGNIDKCVSLDYRMLHLGRNHTTSPQAHSHRPVLENKMSGIQYRICYIYIIHKNSRHNQIPFFVIN